MTSLLLHTFILLFELSQSVSVPLLSKYIPEMLVFLWFHRQKPWIAKNTPKIKCGDVIMSSHALITNWYHICVELTSLINWPKFHMFWMNNKKVTVGVGEGRVESTTPPPPPQAARRPKSPDKIGLNSNTENSGRTAFNDWNLQNCKNHCKVVSIQQQQQIFYLALWFNINTRFRKNKI